MKYVSTTESSKSGKYIKYINKSEEAETND